ncbi:MAG: hypothetical protein ABIO69_00065, partial [Sphingomicrobium sp.]
MTVLDQPASDPHDRAVRWRQLVDLVARAGKQADNPLVEHALNLIRSDRSAVDDALRAAAARAVAALPLPYELVALFASDTLAVSAPMLAAARLERDEWATLLGASDDETRRFILTLHPDLPSAEPYVERRVEEPYVERRAANGRSEQLANGQLPFDDAVAEQDPPEAATAEPVATDDQQVEEPSEEPDFEEPAVDQPEVEEPPVEVPQIDEPPVEDPGFDEPPQEEPPFEQPPAEEPEPDEPAPVEEPEPDEPYVEEPQAEREQPAAVEQEAQVEQASADQAGDITSQPVPSISEVVARIERLRQSRTEPPRIFVPEESRSVAPAGAPSLFRWECGPSGEIAWVEGAPRGALIGRSIARSEEGEGVDEEVERAFALRAPFRDAQLSLPGEGTAAGTWKISGVPAFEPLDGRFAGYRGIALRENGGSYDQMRPDHSLLSDP